VLHFATPVYRGTKTGPFAGLFLLPNPVEGGILKAIYLVNGAAVAGADVVLDINVGGATLFADPDDRPVLAVGETAAEVTGLAIDLGARGGVVTVDLDAGTVDVLAVILDIDDGVEVGGGGGASVETDFITGFEIRKTGNQEVTLAPGAAYVPGAAALVRTAADIALSPAHAVGRWYFYLYDSGGGVGAIEASQTAPAFYSGDAQIKTGDNTRRFVGFAISDGVAWYDFKSQAVDKRATIIWEGAPYSGTEPWGLLIGGTAETDTGTAVSIVGVAPPGTAIMHLWMRLFAGANNWNFAAVNGRIIPANSTPAGYWGSEVNIENYNATGTSGVEKMHPLDIHVERSTTNIYYRYHDQSGSGGSVTLYARGLTYRR
jgi:hypothetical protein